MCKKKSTAKFADFPIFSVNFIDIYQTYHINFRSFIIKISLLLVVEVEENNLE